MIDLYTAAPASGRTVAKLLEKPPCRAQALRFAEQGHRAPALLKISRSGRIPASVDRGDERFAVRASGAILIHLAARAGQLLPPAARARPALPRGLQVSQRGVGDASALRNAQPMPIR
ncbi:hypothetical protein I0D00_01945 [Pseudomonas lalucatii]|uniref:GST N-terminal domain-containing protein n=1 Tax=Pseudomonas lalucatii TaxID=1424203 RepID=A0ABS5PW26_9PSED|nr:hypothetical protein [Pseudomonas lalucatii]MBS7660710.1 hypothetical protein [Pseudomonas lalucatii]MBS7724495.1 hypothetical protein [Pseudomonas lalucatii]QVM87506.1 hypothetical protein I0D68_20925 [Pseudomonas lalucatii]